MSGLDKWLCKSFGLLNVSVVVKICRKSKVFKTQEILTIFWSLLKMSNWIVEQNLRGLINWFDLVNRLSPNRSKDYKAFLDLWSTDQIDIISNETGITFDSSFFNNYFDLVWQCKNRSFYFSIYFFLFVDQVMSG